MTQPTGGFCYDHGSVFVKTENLSKTYRMGTETIHALSDVNFRAHQGDFAVINGPSGSSKSTFLNLVGCIDTATSGETWVADQRISQLSEGQLAELRRDKIGLIFQAFNLIPVLSAFENAEYPLLLQDLSRKNRHERTRFLLEEVGIAELARRRPNELSGGQRQRVVNLLVQGQETFSEILDAEQRELSDSLFDPGQLGEGS